MEARKLVRIGGVGLVLAAASVGPSRSEAVPPTEAEASGPHTAEDLALLAVSEDETVAAAAAGRLRAMGPRGLEVALATHADAVAQLRAGSADREAHDVVRLRSALDTIAAQRDAHASGLYWYTDLSRAQAEARRTGKSILSLRLLGELDEELSCANSRLFRTLLYPHPEVGTTIAQRFVLHWSSERPAPRITIEMGDGRALVRTITGNSVHYVLDADGRPVDAIPGLYAPRPFVRALRDADAIARRCRRLAASGFRACLARAHEDALTKQQRAWDELRASARLGLAPPQAVASLTLGPMPTPGAGTPLSALDVDRLTISKARIERPMLQLIEEAQAGLTDNPLPPWWTSLAGNLLPDAAPAPATMALVRWKTPDADAGLVAVTLARNAAEDTLRNEYVMHRDVHQRFAGAADVSFDALNRWAYAELFLTPADDPWLGLRDPAAYDAIELP